ncbi:MAG TPA: hypothetical protein VEF89_14650 [Solirubrobacteraceae bacterium]|nr:hypothetical protein [Solirubrobacteraceae bacterium]
MAIQAPAGSFEAIERLGREFDPAAYYALRTRDSGPFGNAARSWSVSRAACASWTTRS